MKAAVSKPGIKLGAEPRKVALLLGLIVVAVSIYLFQGSSNDGGNGTSPRRVAVPVAPAPQVAQRLAHRRANQRSAEKSTLRMQNLSLQATLGDIDPTLRLDLLERLQTVKMAGGGRSLFEGGQAPAVAAVIPKGPKVVPRPVVPTAANHTPPAAPSGPQTAPIPLKFYGFSGPGLLSASNLSAHKGFFLDNDNNILIGGEGDILKRRYRIVRLLPKSAEVEDTNTKSQQSLSLMPEVSGGG